MALYPAVAHGEICLFIAAPNCGGPPTGLLGSRLFMLLTIDNVQYPAVARTA